MPIDQVTGLFYITPEVSASLLRSFEKAAKGPYAHMTARERHQHIQKQLKDELRRSKSLVRRLRWQLKNRT